MKAPAWLSATVLTAVCASASAEDSHAVTLRPVAPGSGLRLVSIELGYEGLVNRYCRLALDDGNRASLVPLPPEALHDACQRVKKVLLGDFNGDGWVDVIHAVVVPSQAGVSGEEPVAYLSRAGSDPAQRPSYCYAALLSRQLAPVDLASRLTVARAVARIRDRSGPQAIACQP